MAPNRIRKRTFVVSGLSFLAILAAAVIIVLIAASVTGTADLIRLTVQEGPERTAILGAGVSLSDAGRSNLIQDASFEPMIFRQALTIHAGDETTVTVSSQEAGQGIFGDSFFDQASARIMTRTNEGLELKKTARVIHFGINRVGVFQAVQLPGDMPDKLALLAFAHSGDLSIGVGEKGMIIRNLTGQAPEGVESGLDANLTGIWAGGSGFVACSAAGDLLFSTDGSEWQVETVQGSESLNAVAMSETGLAVAVGSRGRMVAGLQGSVSALQPYTMADLRDITYGQGLFMAVGSHGTIMTSQNGLVWHMIDYEPADDWQAVDYRDGFFCLAGRKGNSATSPDGKHFTPMQKLDTVLEDVVMLSGRQIILLDDAGSFRVTNDGGNSWLLSRINTGMHSRVIGLAGKDKILSAGDSGQLGLAQLVAEIQLDSPLRDSQYRAGDIIFLEKARPDATAASLPGSDPAACQAPWELYGQGSMERLLTDAAPNGGQGCLKLQTGGQGGPVILSQQINAAILQDRAQNDVLQATLWMKQDEVADRSVKVWLTGPFDPVGTTLTNVGTSWKKYTFAFVLPARSGTLAGQEIRFNLSTESGTVWVDRIFLGRVDESDDQLPVLLQQAAETVRPQVMRFDFLGIGSLTAPAASWSLPMHNDYPVLENGCWTSQGGASLHAALTLAAAQAAKPWLVIDAYASEAEMLNLIEYLAGPISEPYGRIRQELGSVVPWTQQLEQIYVELTDQQDIYNTDQLKSDFVNLMIRTISQSPYYRQIKGQLVFIDGMFYRDGVMLSSADYHASDLRGVVRDDRRQTVEIAYQAYLDQIPRNPDKPASSWPELIRGIYLRETATRPLHLADVTDLALYDLGRQSGLVCLTMQTGSDDHDGSVYLAASRILAQAGRGIPLQISAVAGTDGYEHETMIRTYGFRDGDRYALVFANLSGQTATCQLLTDLPLHGSFLYKYDEQGNMLSRQSLRRITSKFTILPGGVVLLVKEEVPDQP